MKRYGLILIYLAALVAAIVIVSVRDAWGSQCPASWAIVAPRASNEATGPSYAWSAERTLRRPEFPMHIQALSPPPEDDLFQGEGFMLDSSRWRAYYLSPEVKFCIMGPDGLSCGTPPPGTVLLIPVLPDSL